MKTKLLFLLALVAIGSSLKAQEPTKVDTLTIITESVLPADTVIRVVIQDTTIIRIGKKEIQVIDPDCEPDYNCQGDKKKKRSRKFDGHWDGIELGFNGFDNTDYSQYEGIEFMSLAPGKSSEFSLRFSEVNVGLIKSYVGLVSGIGLRFNSYRFENPYTLLKGAERTEPVLLERENLSKTKLAVSYLEIPLLLEFQIPVNERTGRLYVNAGVIGGVKIGSHTKVKYGDDTEKDHGGFHLNTFNYAATARVGYNEVGLFATYNLNPLFETGKGPELTPFTIGISLLDLN